MQSGQITREKNNKKIYRFLILFFIIKFSAGGFLQCGLMRDEKSIQKVTSTDLCGERKFVQRKFLHNKILLKKPLISLNGKHLQMQLTKFSLWSYVRWDIFSPHALYASFMAEWRRFISMTLSQQHHNRQIWKNCENLIKIKFHKILHIFIIDILHWRISKLSVWGDSKVKRYKYYDHNELAEKYIDEIWNKSHF